jgi:TPR repeat protein
MKKAITAGVVGLHLSLGLASPLAAGPLEDGVIAYERGDYATTLRLIRPPADQGNAAAQNILGLMYMLGQGVKQDNATAVIWYRKAADQGFAGAQSDLGSIYNEGIGVKQDYVEAVKWYRKAAEQGFAGGELGLASMYFNGHGVKQDYVTALIWYRKAADQGDHKAQFNLGLMYGDGHGVKQDYVQAHLWFNLAAARFLTSNTDSRAGALNNRDRIAAKMTPAQIAEAQKLAREWKPTPPHQCRSSFSAEGLHPAKVTNGILPLIPIVAGLDTSIG